MKVLRLFNRQKSRTLDLALLRRIARDLLENILDEHDFELGIHLIDSGEMAELNETFLRHTGSTDVITFNHAETPDANGLHGELFISVDDALAQAGSFGATWQSEVVRYIAHGLLHLEGHDDLDPIRRRAMKRQENKLVKELSQRFHLGKLSRVANAAKDK